MVNGKTFELRKIDELFALVKEDFKTIDEEGLIDEGNLIKTIRYCNEKLGIPLREIKQVCTPVHEFRAKLPTNFDKLYYVTALKATNTMIHDGVNPFNNNFDADVIYEAELKKGCFAGSEQCGITIKRETNTTIHTYETFINLDISNRDFLHPSSPNGRRKGRYTVEIIDGEIHTPFRSGELYVMYLANSTDEEGNLLYPFHPIITPWYEYMLKEKILIDAIMNSDGNYGDRLKLIQIERAKAWLDCFNLTTEKGYNEYLDLRRKRELGWFNEYFKAFDNY